MFKIVLVCVFALSLSLNSHGLDQDVTLPEREPAVLDVRKQIQAGDGKAALELAEKLVDQSPEKATSYIVRAEAQVAAGDNASAMTDLKKALQIAPIDVHAAMALSLLQAKAGDSDAAWKTLEEPTSRRPTSTLLKIARVDVLIAEGKLEDAGTAMYQVNMNINKQGQHKMMADRSAAVYDRLATAWVEAGRRDMGIMNLGFARAKGPANNGMYALKLAGLYAVDDQFDNALKHYEDAQRYREITENAALMKQVQDGIARVHADIAELAELRQQGEQLAKELVPVIDAYRREPTNWAARQAVIDAVGPYYEKLFESPAIEMIVPLLPEQPDGLSEPKALSDARYRAIEIYRQFNVSGSFSSSDVSTYFKASDKVLAVYPYWHVHRQRAENAMNAYEYTSAYEHALLAEAVIFAEYYYNRKSTNVSKFGPYLGLRQLAKLAKNCDPPNGLTPVEARVYNVLKLQAEEDWLAADAERNQVSETLVGVEDIAFRNMLQRAWVVDRKWLEMAYHDAYQEAIEQDNRPEQDRIAQYMFKREVDNQRFGGMLLNLISDHSDQKEFDRYFTQLMRQDPYHIYALHMAASRAGGQRNDAENLLYTNAVVQFIEEAGSPRQLQGILMTSRNTLERLEAALKPDVANGYWNTVIAFEKQAMENKEAPNTYQPVVEAAAMRVIELAPNNPSIVGLIAKLRLSLKNYTGCIAAAEQAIKLDPKMAGTGTLIIADAYRQLLPSSTLDRDALKANYLKSIEAYRKAIELGANGNIALINLFEAQMYEALDMIDESLGKYKAVLDQTTEIQPRAYLQYKIAQLYYDHQKADKNTIMAYLSEAIKGYEQQPPKAFDHISAQLNAVSLHGKLTRQESP